MFIFSVKSPGLAECFSKHRADVLTCFGKFEDFFRILFSDNPDPATLKSIQLIVDNNENAADGELRHLGDQFHGAFLPATRTHLIALMQSTDEIANRCQKIIRYVMLEKIEFPSSIRDDVLEIIAITKTQLSILYTAIDLLINNFKELTKNRRIPDDIRAEESKVDRIQAALHERIFTLNIPLTQKIYYRDMLEHICHLSDMIEDISDHIQTILVEREG